MNYLRLGVALLTMGLVGCETAERVYFEHGPTEKFMETWDFEDSSLEPFSVQQVVVAPSFIGLDHENTRLNLVLFSKDDNASVWVDRVVLSARSKLSNPAKGVDIGKNLVVVEQAYGNPGAYQVAEKLFDVKNAVLEELSGGESVFVYIYFRPESDSDEIVRIEYEFKRITERHVIWPT